MDNFTIASTSAGGATAISIAAALFGGFIATRARPENKVAVERLMADAPYQRLGNVLKQPVSRAD